MEKWRQLLMKSDNRVAVLDGIIELHWSKHSG